MILIPAQRPAWFRYVIAVLAVAVAAAVRAWILGIHGTRAPFVTFYPAVILAALYGGLPAGLLATALSALTTSFAWMEPVGQLSMPDPTDWLSLGVFVMSSSAISLLTQAMQRAQARASEAEAQVRLAAERSRAEEDLRRYKLLAEHSRDVLLFMRRDDGRILEANHAAAQAYGYTRAELQSLSIHQLRADGEQGLTLAQHAEADTGGILFETVHRRNDGSTFPVEVSSQSAIIGDTRTVISVIRDITERKQAEEEKAELEGQFHQAQKMESVGRLAGGVAHDFNNLLTVINGYSQLLLRDLKAGDPLRDSIEEIHSAGERGAGLTHQLLAFSRKQVLNPLMLDLNRVVSETQPMLARLLGEDVELCVELHAGAATICADRHQLEQVVMNLAVNSRDAMPDGGKLLIETAVVEWDESQTRSHPDARVGRYVMLAVTDTGVGMNEETKNRIFEPFFTTKGIGKGTGLGLSMVQGVVAQSGGYVEVYSEKGQGTTFKIYLPALAEAAADAARPADVPLGGKETVLVVEDQAEVRKYAVAVLEEYGYRVIPVENAGEAPLLCEREHIDLVLTDVVMPHVSGREVADRLKTLDPGIKVLFMSGYTDNIIEHHGVLEEGAEFIEKPFSPEELARKVRAVLGPPVLAPTGCILVVDDEAGVRGFLRKVLEQGGYEVIEAADGKQALQQARAGHVDLVITDIVMPEQEGIETIQALRREVPGVGIIAISGAFHGQFLEVAQMMGAAAVLNKPVSAELLLARVAEVLKRQR